MSLLNNSFINADGSPVPGRVPTQLLVYADKGYQLPEKLRREIEGAYAKFCLDVKLSPAKYHLKNAELSDGTQVRMESNDGLDRVMVWPTGAGKGGFVKVYRGLCYVPFMGANTWEPPEYASSGDAVTYMAQADAGYGVAIGRPYYGYQTVGGKTKFFSAGRFVKKDKETEKYGDKIRGIIEGLDGFFLITYHTNYTLADNKWVMTEDVVTAAGPLVFLDNQVIACSSGAAWSTPLGSRFLPVRYGTQVVGFSKLGGAHLLDASAPTADRLDKPDPRLKRMLSTEYDGIYLASFEEPSPCTTLVANTDEITSSNFPYKYADYYPYHVPSKRYFSVSQDKSQVVMHGGDGAYRYFNITLNQAGKVEVTLGDSFAGYTESIDVPATHTIARAYKDNALVAATWTGHQTQTETSSTVSVPDSNGDPGLESEQTSTSYYYRTETYVLDDLTLTAESLSGPYEYKVRTEYLYTVGDVQYASGRLLSFTYPPVVESFQNEYKVLFWNPHDAVCMYYKTETYTRMEGFRITGVLTETAFVAEIRYVTTVTLYLRLGDKTYEKQLESTLGPYTINGPGGGFNVDETKKITSIVRGTPTEQGEVPFISYRRKKDDSYEVIGYFYIDPVVYGPPVEKVHPFTEDGFVDWLSDCGHPTPPDSDHLRYPTCFVVGGPKLKEEI